MIHKPALAVLRDELDQRTVELDAAIAKLKATPRNTDEYGTVYEARWEASEAYSKAWTAWYEETEKPPADSTTGGDANSAGSLRDAVIRLERGVDVSKVNSSGLKLSDYKSEGAMLGSNDIVQDIDLIGERRIGMLRGGHVNAQSQKFVGFQQSSPSVGGASDDASVGTPESTEGDQTPGGGEKKKHPAVTAAGCGETKPNGKQGNDFNV